MTTTPLDPQNFNSAAVNQSHDGQGDNVLNKYIQSIAPDLLRRPIQAILNAIANDDLDKAKSDIELIESMGGKDSNAQMLISALRIFNDLVGDEEQSRAIYQSLKQSLASTHQVPNDVITAALMLYEFKDSQEAMAAKRYLQTKHSPVSYSTYIFNKNLASTEQLSQFWEAHELNLDLPALKGLIIGALRVQAHDLLAKVYPSLEHYEPNLSNKALTFFCQGAILFPRFTNRHYYLLTYPDKVEVDRLVVEGASLLNQGQSDRMTIGACASFATYTQNEISDLPTALCPFINKIDDSFTVLKLNLQSYLNKEKTPSPVAFQDDDFIEGVLSSKHFPTLFTTNSAIMLRRALKLDLAPELARMEKLVRVSLLAKLVTIEPTTQRQLIDYLDKMLNDTPYDLTAYPFHHSYHLCNLLDEAELHRYIPKILAQFQIQGAWLSPPKGMYLDSLIKTKQLSTLNTTLALTHPDEHQALYHSCRARYFEAIGEDKNVLKHAYLAIESSDNHINAWIYLIKFAGRSQHVSSAELRSIFETIPDECFIRPSPYSWELLATCLRYGDFSRAERIALDLFVVSPNEMALHYSNWVNSAFLHDQGSFQPTYATTVGDHQNCYLLESNGTTNYKLVTAVKNQHPDFILPTSPLGKQLLEGKKGDTIENQLIEYRIVEIVSPFEGALQIANKLRQELNDGTDSFAMLTIPEDPKQLNEFLKKTIAMSNKRRSESSLQLLSDNNHPIQVRGAHQANHSKWSGAVAAILSPNFAKNSTPNQNSRSRVLCSPIFTD
ncbi:GreA/GreB family elongation factor [Shewanella psychropiezotolerans]|uniref:GreA/GreB family elongation factor n=1 Tax=Shewanella psychropiezotolerans TaxID=2593655 RepID=A0ABX5WVQ9_9GAMM|nr:GreA/GreB family elongation factor [Shewanella psychropiezotolerans]QDO82472.1 GreA/GreB family elongation factor [Shewanella psychropiezotolerans]